MWVIELNFAGRQFTHRVPDRVDRCSASPRAA